MDAALKRYMHRKKKTNVLCVDFPSNRTVCITYLDVLIRERFRAVKGKKRRTLELKKNTDSRMAMGAQSANSFLLHQLLFASKCFWRQSSQI